MDPVRLDSPPELLQHRAVKPSPTPALCRLARQPRDLTSSGVQLGLQGWVGESPEALVLAFEVVPAGVERVEVVLEVLGLGGGLGN